MVDSRAPRLIQDKAPWVPEDDLTIPSWLHKMIICNDDCDNCVLNTEDGCAADCTRFPDKVCEGCPCRASAFAGKVNES